MSAAAGSRNNAVRGIPLLARIHIAVNDLEANHSTIVGKGAGLRSTAAVDTMRIDEVLMRQRENLAVYTQLHSGEEVFESNIDRITTAERDMAEEYPIKSSSDLHELALDFGAALIANKRNCGDISPHLRGLEGGRGRTTCGGSRGA